MGKRNYLLNESEYKPKSLDSTECGNVFARVEIHKKINNNKINITSISNDNI